MRQKFALSVFWGAVGLVVYTYLLFPIIIALRGLIRPRSIRYGQDTPMVSFVIAAYNEASMITKKLDNTFALAYPRSKLEVIVASDGSDDGTNELVTAYAAPEVRLLDLPRQGKNLTLNSGVAAARGEIVVFTDADSLLKPDALHYLVAPFADPEVGVVGGDYHYIAEGDEGSGERTYWGFERKLKELQSRAGSMTSATGQIYAIRRFLFKPLPVGVTDDFYTSVQAHAHRLRLVFEPRAVAYGPVASTSKLEFGRKVRVISAGLRGVWLMRTILNPRHYGFTAIQVLTHKALRRLMVFPLILTTISAPFLWSRGWLYKLATLGQLGVHSAGLAGWSLQHTRLGRSKLLSLPFFFELVNAAAVVAVVNLLRGQRHDIWVPQREQFADVEPAAHVDQIA